MFIPITKKRLIPIAILIISAFTPLVYLSKQYSAKGNTSPHHQTTHTTKIQPVQQRHVTKFHTAKLAESSLFSALKKKIEITNLNINLIGNSHPAYAGFAFSIKYSTFDDDGKLVQNNIRTVKSNENNKNGINSTISVAAKEILDMQVKILNLPKQKYAKLGHYHLEYPSSSIIQPKTFKFAVVASGLQTTPKIKLEEQYVKRGEKKITSVLVGYYSVYNSTNSFKQFFSSGIGFIVALLLVYVVINFGGFILSLIRNAIKLTKAIYSLASTFYRTIAESIEAGTNSAGQAAMRSTLEESEVADQAATQVENIAEGAQLSEDNVLENSLPRSADLTSGRITVRAEIHPQPTDSLLEKEANVGAVKTEPEQINVSDGQLAKFNRDNLDNSSPTGTANIPHDSIGTATNDIENSDILLNNESESTLADAGINTALEENGGELQSPDKSLNVGSDGTVAEDSISKDLLSEIANNDDILSTEQNTTDEINDGNVDTVSQNVEQLNSGAERSSIDGGEDKANHGIDENINSNEKANNEDSKTAKKTKGEDSKTAKKANDKIKRKADAKTFPFSTVFGGLWIVSAATALGILYGGYKDK